MFKVFKTGVAVAAMNAGTGADNQGKTAMEAANNSKNSAMEAENHVQHGASSKSHTSRRYFIGVACSLLLALCMGLFTACGDDDGDKGGNIVGLWTIVNLTVDAINPTYPERAESVMQSITPALFQGTTIEFKSNGSVIFTVPNGGSNSGTYTHKDSRYTLTIDGDELTGYLENNVLTLVSDDLDQVFSRDDDWNPIETYRQAGFTKFEMKMTFEK